MINTKILNKVDTKIRKLIKDIEDLELDTKKIKNYKKIEEFILKYKKGLIDIELLKSFSNEIIYDIDIVKILETKSNLEKLESTIFNEQLEKINQIIEDYIKRLNIIISNIKRSGIKSYTIKEKKKTLINLQNIKNYINNNQKIIFNNELLELFYDLINEIDINNEEKQTYIKEFIQSQSTQQIEKIKINITEKEKEKKESKIDEARRRKIEKIIAETNIEENIPLENNIEEQTNELLEIAKDKTKNIEKANEPILLALESLKNEENFENRKLIYMTINDIVGKKTLIQLDVKENIIPKLENNKNDIHLYEQLKNILEIYNNIEIEYESMYSKTITEKLEEINLREEAELNEEINDTLLSIENILFGSYENRKNIDKINYIKLYEKYTELKNLSDTINIMIEIYYESIKNEEDLEEIKTEFKTLEQIHKDMTTLLTDVINLEENISDKDIENSERFYGPQPENIFILLDDDRDDEKTYIENDIEEDNRVLTYTSFLKILKLQVNNTFAYKTNEANHKAKSDLEKESFLKHFRIKNIKSGLKRIGYSRFSTSLDKILEEYPNNPHIIFIYSFANGAISKDGKNQKIQASVKRCKKNQDDINYIINLFNTDLSKLPKEKQENIKKEIRNFIKSNYEKLDRIINKNLEKGVK